MAKKETKNAQVTGIGRTIGEALKEVSDLTGWYPQLNFCNLLMISNEFSDINLIKIVDYFAITYRVQDSCLIAFSDGSAHSGAPSATGPARFLWTYSSCRT